MLMSSADYRESLRGHSPKVFINGRRVADDPELAPGVAAIGVSYDYALRDDLGDLMRAEGSNRMLCRTRSSNDLLHKLEALRALCQQTGCAQRYLVGDALNAFYQAPYLMDAESKGEYHQRLKAYWQRAQDEDLAIGIAMTDAKGDRSQRSHQQTNPDPMPTSLSAAPMAS